MHRKPTLALIVLIALTPMLFAQGAGPGRKPVDAEAKGAGRTGKLTDELKVLWTLPLKSNSYASAPVADTNYDDLLSPGLKKFLPKPRRRRRL